MKAYYNEIDPRAAAWLRELIAQGHIAPGDVDERSIADVRAADLVRYAQCHFFAGIGVWSAALRGAGWSDERPVWTGSCPCQPFSAAGRGDGFDDARHLWPEFYRLIAERRPPVVFGEQVASKDGLQWLDLVHADLEAADYAVGAVDLSAAGVGAPHIRARLYWVADADDARLEGLRRPVGQHGTEGWHAAERYGATGGLSLDVGNAAGERCGEARNSCRPATRGAVLPSVTDATGDLGNASRGGCGERRDATFAGCRGHAYGAELTLGLGDARRGRIAWAGDTSDTDGPGPTNEHWRAADWLLCRDGKWRAVEPGTFPLAHGAPARVGRLRGYGNAICLPLAQAFIESFEEARELSAASILAVAS